MDKSHSRHIPGTGLGLAIAKEIIRIHKAKVQVQSEVGKGTTFMITFPPAKVKSKMGKEHVAEVVEPLCLFLMKIQWSRKESDPYEKRTPYAVFLPHRAVGSRYCSGHGTSHPNPAVCS